MRNFDYLKLVNVCWDSEIVGFVAQIHEFKGRQALYLKQNPVELDKLIEIAKRQSTESSNEIEGIRTTNARLKQLCEDKTTPKNRAEQEIAGYRDALNLIHESFEYIPIQVNYILQLHKILMAHTNLSMGGVFKNVQNYIAGTDEIGRRVILFTPPAPYETAAAMQQLCETMNLVIGNHLVEPLLVIPVFIHDFLCIHPFCDGNGRMSRLLTTLLLYQSGYVVGRYISLESKIAKTKASYYEALAQSQVGWMEEKEDVLPFIKYLLGTILAAYRDFEDRMELVTPKRASIEIVADAVKLKIGKFTKSEVMELCPSISRASVENALSALVEQGKISREGVGRGVYYVRMD